MSTIIVLHMLMNMVLENNRISSLNYNSPVSKACLNVKKVRRKRRKHHKKVRFNMNANTSVPAAQSDEEELNKMKKELSKWVKKTIHRRQVV